MTQRPQLQLQADSASTDAEIILLESAGERMGGEVHKLPLSCEHVETWETVGVFLLGHPLLHVVGVSLKFGTNIKHSHPCSINTTQMYRRCEIYREKIVLIPPSCPLFYCCSSFRVHRSTHKHVSTHTWMLETLLLTLFYTKIFRSIKNKGKCFNFNLPVVFYSLQRCTFLYTNFFNIVSKAELLPVTPTKTHLCLHEKGFSFF